MTLQETFDFCKEHEVELYTRYDFITDAYILRMRKRGRGIEQKITREALCTPGFHELFLKRLLTDMAAKLDNGPEPSARQAAKTIEDF